MTARSVMDGAVEPEEAIYLPAASTPARRHAPYSAEVREAMRDNRVPNVYVFAGPQCWDRAIRRRMQFGAGTALVLPDDASPEELTWPPLDSLIVAWPLHDEVARLRKLRLAQARHKVEATLANEDERLLFRREWDRQERQALLRAQGHAANQREMADDRNVDALNRRDVDEAARRARAGLGVDDVLAAVDERMATYADRKGFRVAVIAGEDEFARDAVQVKNLVTQQASEHPLGALVRAVQATLNDTKQLG